MTAQLAIAVKLGPDPVESEPIGALLVDPQRLEYAVQCARQLEGEWLSAAEIIRSPEFQDALRAFMHGWLAMPLPGKDFTDVTTQVERLCEADLRAWLGAGPLAQHLFTMRGGRWTADIDDRRAAAAVLMRLPKPGGKGGRPQKISGRFLWAECRWLQLALQPVAKRLNAGLTWNGKKQVPAPLAADVEELGLDKAWRGKRPPQPSGARSAPRRLAWSGRLLALQILARRYSVSEESIEQSIAAARPRVKKPRGVSSRSR